MPLKQEKCPFINYLIEPDTLRQNPAACPKSSEKLITLGKNNKLAQIYQIMHSKIMIKFVLIIKWNLLKQKSCI